MNKVFISTLAITLFLSYVVGLAFGLVWIVQSLAQGSFVNF